jgi:DNA-binding NarL/FixJ family response regulator
MRALLEASGHVVVGIAHSADHAIATALREGPDLVLMDIALAGPRDGVDAAPACSLPHIPIFPCPNAQRRQDRSGFW